MTKRRVYMFVSRSTKQATMPDVFQNVKNRDSKCVLKLDIFHFPLKQNKMNTQELYD